MFSLNGIPRQAGGRTGTGQVSTLLFCVVVGVIAIIDGLIVVTALRVRTQPNPARGFIGSPKAEMVWTLLPVIILIAVAITSYQLLQDDSAADALSVQNLGTAAHLGLGGHAGR
jgi:heme/copper-type cytochrome/quinol oxidase subunit 2